MDKRIKIVCFVATFIAVIMVAPYFILFHYGFSNDSSAWSNFGDYINGILTPILTTVNIYVFIRLTSKISEIEDNRTNEAIQQERERSIKELEQALTGVPLDDQLSSRLDTLNIEEYMHGISSAEFAALLR